MQSGKSKELMRSLLFLLVCHNVPGVPPERIAEVGVSYVITDQVSLRDVVSDIRVG
jgi:hypothetical protein